MPEDDQKTLKRGAIKIADLKPQEADGFVQVYANNVGSSSTFYDLRLVFGQILAPPQGEPVLENRASITMSWEHVLPFRNLLNKLLAAYEKDHGPIRVHGKPEPDEDNSAEGPTPPEEIAT